MPEKAGKVILERERERGGEREVEQNEAGLRGHMALEGWRSLAVFPMAFQVLGSRPFCTLLSFLGFLRCLCIVIINPPHAFWFYLR